MEQILPLSPQEGTNCAATLILDSGLLNVREYLPIVINHPVCDTLLWQP